MSKWTEFYERHQQRNFTPVFNAHLEAVISDTSATLSERVWAWIMRRSWGNHSDCCSNAQGIALSQADCAKELGVDRRAVNPAFLEFERRNYISVKGRQIRPVDDPTFANSSLLVGNGATKGEHPAKATFQAFFSDVWARHHQAEFEEYQALERRRKEINLLALGEWKHFKKLSETAPTNGTQSLERLRHGVHNGSDNTSTTAATKPPRILKSKQENVKAPAPASSSSFTKQVREALQPHGTIDDVVVNQLISACRTNAIDCTAEEIAHFISAKAKLITKRTANPIGFLLAIVPKCFAGESFRAHRRAAAEAIEQTAATDEERIKALENWLEMFPPGTHRETPAFHAELERLKAKRPRTAKAGSAA